MRRRTSTTAKRVAILSRKPLQVHDRRPTQSERQSHRVRLLANVAFIPQLRPNHFPSRNLKPQSVRTQTRVYDMRLPRRTHMSMLPVPKELILPGKKVATAFSAYRVALVCKIKYQQLLKLLEKRDRGIVDDHGTLRLRLARYSSKSSAQYL